MHDSTIGDKIYVESTGTYHEIGYKKLNCLESQKFYKQYSLIPTGTS